jgi:serine/threonine protein kinase
MGGSESQEVDLESIKAAPENTQQYFKSSIYTQNGYPTRSKNDTRFGEITIVEVNGYSAAFKKRIKIEDHKKFISFARNKQDRMKFDSTVFVKLLDYEAGLLAPSETEDGDYIYYIDCYFEYIENDFLKILEQRMSHKENFSHEELMEPLKCLLKAGEYLESIGSRHGDIRPESIMVTDDGQYKLMENIRDKVGTGQRIAFAAGGDVYISPEIFTDFCHGVIKNKHDRTKCDVYSAGLIILEAATLRSVQGLFDKDNTVFNSDLFAELVDLAQDNYSEHKGFLMTLRRMLITDEHDRPTYKGLKIGGKVESSSNNEPSRKVQQGYGNPSKGYESSGYQQKDVYAQGGQTYAAPQKTPQNQPYTYQPYVGPGTTPSYGTTATRNPLSGNSNIL